jgi:hypothetical protein
LPPASREILEELRTVAEARHGAALAAGRRLQGARDEAEAAALAVNNLVDPRPRVTAAPDDWMGRRVMEARTSMPVGEDQPILIEARARLRRADEAFARANANYTTAGEAFHAAKRVLTIAENFLAAHPGVEPFAADEVDGDAKPKKGESLESAIDRFRKRLRELAADRDAVAAAMLPAADAKAAARRQIEALAARGAPDLTRLLEVPGAEIAWPTTFERIQAYAANGAGAGGVASVDAVALVAWLCKDQMIAAAAAEIDALAGDESAALSAEERAERIAAIEAEILAVERDECDLVEQSNGTIIHRDDVDPRALLRLADHYEVVRR